MFLREPGVTDLTYLLLQSLRRLYRAPTDVRAMLNWLLPLGNASVRTDEPETTAHDLAVDVEIAKRPGPVTGPPRGLTFERRESERRDRLEALTPSNSDRRSRSADRRLQTTIVGAPLRATSSVPSGLSSLAALPQTRAEQSWTTNQLQEAAHIEETQFTGGHFDEDVQYPSDIPSDPEKESDEFDDLQLQEEVEAKWVLNLSMRFRDKSDREKFFITLMQEPNKWLRITVSCDYRIAPPESLEANLKKLYYQRDKSSKIYDSVRESLPDIKFFSTVTNLKLQTEDCRLHVHVTEDVNEVIIYPALSLLQYIKCTHFPENEVYFDSHESGFVYRVQIRGIRYIKKEIPSPEAVEEFLYEVNALNSLKESSCVVNFEGLVVDELQQSIKGLVLAFAENGALVDILYDLKNTGLLPWTRRIKWARQIVQGLRDIHEAGYVQGDFTLSNIVIDASDNALIIDINRRGCPVGWEPPEMRDMIEAGQKISIYIGVKTDIFQLGMVLWALAAVHDEPERVRPLTTEGWEAIPEWYSSVFKQCIAKEPRNRPSAEKVFETFTKAAVAMPSAETTHPAAWHLPPHSDSGFDETRGGPNTKVDVSSPV